MSKEHRGVSALRIVQKLYPQVTRVVDAKQSITVEVTSADTKVPGVKNHRTCAMAVACKRKMNADGMIISVTKAYVIKGKVATRYCVPESVSREIVAFDRKGNFDPGTYRLNAPHKTELLGHRTGGNLTTKGAGKPRAAFHTTENIRTSLLAFVR